MSVKIRGFIARHKCFWLALFLNLALLGLIWVARSSPHKFEAFYTYGFFAWLVNWTGVISDWLPFSFNEIFFIALILSLLAYLWRGVKKIKKLKSGRLKAILRAGLKLLTWAMILVFAFYLMWGLNYFRPRLNQSPNFEKDLVNHEQACRLARECLTALTHLKAQACPDWRLAKELEQAIDLALLSVGDHPIKTATRIKYFLGGWLSALPTTGVSLPFLPEAHIALDLTDYEKPFVIAHEKAHLKGRALESEANYLAILACLNSEHPGIRKSGLLMTLRLLIPTLPPRERSLILSGLDARDRRELSASSIRLAFKNRVVIDFVRWIYGNYLKTQQIQDGMANYSAAVELLLGYKLNSLAPVKIDKHGRISVL